MTDPKRACIFFLGAGLGGVARFFLDRALTGAVDGRFPLGTLVINITGCLAIGLLFGALPQREEGWRLLIMTGLLGGYTTFSTFGRETVSLLQAGRWGAGTAYVLLSVAGGLLAAWIGMRGR